MKKAGLISLAVFFMMAGQAMGAWWWPPSNIEIFPQDPTSCDVVVITLSGEWPDSCIPYASAISLTGNDIYFDVILDYPSGIGCATVITPWERTRSVGPLSPGTYTIYTRLLEDPSVPETYTLMTEFTVTPESHVDTIYYVDAVHGDDDNNGLTEETSFATIQKGIDMSKSGDTIIIAEGIYTGEGNHDIDFYCKAVTVRSTNPDDPNVVAATVIDCQGYPHDGFYFHSNEGPNSVLAGITIANCLHGIHCCDYSGPTISHCTITENYATIGGGIFCQYSSPTITNCTIAGNLASLGGGVFYWSGSPTITNCIITGNRAEHGGGVYCTVANNPTITNSIITANSAKFYGGGIYFGSSNNPTIINCTITDNRANWGGGGIHCRNSDSTITNCTISGNSAGFLGGGGIASSSSNPTITNCIFWDNSPQQIKGSASVTYSNVQGGWDDQGNIDEDPCFVQPGYWDMNDIWIDGDYHLLRTSPSIDAGDNNSVPADTTDLDGDGNTTEPIPFDLEGNPRFVDQPEVPDTGNGTAPIVDMGAFEANYIEVAMKFTPQALNLRSKGKWVKAHFVLPEGFSIDDVDANTPAVIEPLGIESDYMNIFINEDSLVEIEAAFSRADFCASAISDDTIEVTVVGLLTTGQCFYGTDTIKIINKSLESLAAFASYWLQTDCSKPHWCAGLDVNQDSVINFIDFAMFDSCCFEVIKQ